MIIYTHKDCINHLVPSGHPERPDRLKVLLNHLKEAGFLADHRLVPSQQIPTDLIRRAHHPNYFESLERQLPTTGLKSLDTDTWLSPISLSAAKYAAGAVWRGTLDVVSGVEKRVFCAVRPPGHHAETNKPMGFCMVNSVAVSAINALTLDKIDRVVIIDFDVHHGNGTVDICRNNPNILVCSSFQHPFYPNRLFNLSQKNIINTPLDSGSNGDTFRRAISDSWWAAIENHEPDLFLISAGFDGHQLDPLGQLNLAEDDYAWITKKIVQLAIQYADGRIVSALEGGYHLNALAKSALAHLSELAL